MEDSKPIFCSSKFLWSNKRISSKFGHAPSKRFCMVVNCIYVFQH